MKSVLDYYYRFLKVCLTLLMAGMLIPVALQIVSRTTGIVPWYVWTEEAARFCFVWLIMIGAMVAVRDGSHFDVDLMPKPKSKREEGVSKLVVHGLMMIMAVVFSGYGWQFAQFGARQNSEMSGINMLSIYISFPLAGLTWILFLMEKMVGDVQLIRPKTMEDES